MVELLEKIQEYHQAEKAVMDTIKYQSKQIIILNKEISDYLHILELLPLKASEIAKVTAKLRQVLKERRDLKASADLNCTLNNPNLKSFTIPSAETLMQAYDEKKDNYVEEARANYNSYFTTI